MSFIKTLLYNSVLVAIGLVMTSVSQPLKWNYPMKDMTARSMLKGFGLLIDDQFYKGREKLFPSQFKGIHSGQDLEALGSEQSDQILVPVYSVTGGTVIFKGTLQGYGGVILLKLDNGQNTALYGHVKVPKNLVIGTHFQSGELLTYLGNGYSSETAGERKHLHFGIHKGTNLYFHGHEINRQILSAQWEDPIPFLKSMGAVEPLNP